MSGPKIGYTTLSCHQATAYLNEEPEGRSCCLGIEKHTGDGVLVRWDDDAEVWLEVDPGSVAPAPAVVTRSVEIPEAAVKAAKSALDALPVCLKSSTVRIALAAALPYLVPAEPTKLYDWGPDWDQAGYEAAVAKGMPRLPGDHVAAAPAGDGGLREALEKIKAELEERSNDGEAHLFLNIPYWQLEELLAAHPAAPAVPQPVDREALSAAVYEKASAVVLEGGYITTLIAPEDAVAAVLAVLAGEQEQADG